MIILDAFSNPRFSTQNEEAIGAIILKHVKRERATTAPQDAKPERKKNRDLKQIMRDQRRDNIISFILQRPRRRIEIQEYFALSERAVQQILANLVRDYTLEKSNDGAFVIYSVKVKTPRA